MNVGALLLLLGGVGGLEKEDGLGGEEDAGGVEELWTYSAGNPLTDAKEAGAQGERKTASEAGQRRKPRLWPQAGEGGYMSAGWSGNCGQRLVPYNPDSHLSDYCRS